MLDSCIYYAAKIKKYFIYPLIFRSRFVVIRVTYWTQDINMLMHKIQVYIHSFSIANPPTRWYFWRSRTMPYGQTVLRIKPWSCEEAARLYVLTQPRTFISRSPDLHAHDFMHCAPATWFAEVFLLKWPLSVYDSTTSVTEKLLLQI